MSDAPLVECSLCGRDGVPPTACGTCHGRARTQSRAMTLSEERTQSRRNRNDRYGDDGGIGPRIVHMPGSDPEIG